MRPIDAYELAEQVWKSMDYNPHKDPKIARNHRLEHEHFLRLIAAEPTLDPVKYAEVLKKSTGCGEWVWTQRGTDDRDQFWVCSKCGSHTYFKTKFCSDCGRTMLNGGKNGKD